MYAWYDEDENLQLNSLLLILVFFLFPGKILYSLLYLFCFRKKIDFMCLLFCFILRIFSLFSLSLIRCIFVYSSWIIAGFLLNRYLFCFADFWILKIIKWKKYIIKVFWMRYGFKNVSKIKKCLHLNIQKSLGKA